MYIYPAIQTNQYLTDVDKKTLSFSTSTSVVSRILQLKAEKATCLANLQLFEKNLILPHYHVNHFILKSL